MDYTQFEILSFDCYGTLIDWKRSILDIIHPVISDYSLDIPREDLFRLFLEIDREYTIKDYTSYKEILYGIMDLIATKLNLLLHPNDRTCLVERFGQWEPFDDTVDTLEELHKDYKLAIISNVDDDLFAITNSKLQVEFDFIVTAEQVKSYKPSHNNFRKALSRFGTDSSKVLHLAQSIYHDIIPTNQLGWYNVWVNRYIEPERTNPDEYPNLEVPDLKSFVRIINH